MRRTFAGLVVATLLVGLAPGLVSAAQFSPGSTGIGDPYFPNDGNGGYNVLSYDLEARYEPDTDVSGAPPRSARGRPRTCRGSTSTSWG